MDCDVVVQFIYNLYYMIILQSLEPAQHAMVKITFTYPKEITISDQFQR